MPTDDPTPQPASAPLDDQVARASADATERRLREVFAQAPAFFAALTGPNHILEFANAAYQRLIGKSENIVGRPIAEVVPEVVGQGFIRLLDSVYATGKPFIGNETTVALQREEGEPVEERIVDFIFQPVSDAEGKTTGIVVQGTDVTDAVQARRSVEELLRVSEETRARAEESEANYRFLANSLPVQVWAADASGQLDYASERTAEYFGVTTNDVLGERWIALLHPEDIELTVSRWTHSVQTGEPYETEFRLRRANGTEYRWHLARATPQRDEHGAIVRWVGTNTDIEDRRRSEAELRRLTVEATEANRAKGDFLASMSHELRTPLNAIGGYAQLMELGIRGPVTEEQRIDLQKIQRSKNHLDSLIGDVLTFAKAGVGSIEVHADPIALRATLDAVVEMIAPQAQAKKLALRIGEVPADAIAVGDEDRVRQVLLNIFANALKFTPAGGSITVAVTVGTDNVSTAITDTGIGIHADKLERIFEAFVQAERPLSSRDNGVGLGLAISRQLARAMNGNVSVTSTPGTGSTFTFSLPRKRE